MIMVNVKNVVFRSQDREKGMKGSDESGLWFCLIDNGMKANV